MATVTETIKLAGPDQDGNFKVLQTKNTTMVWPGEVYTTRVVTQLCKDARTRASHRTKLDVTIVEAKLTGGEMARFGITECGYNSFSEESGGKVLDKLRDRP